VPQNVLDEKSSACHVIGRIAKCTGDIFAPHYQQAVTTLRKMCYYGYSVVRENAIKSLCEVIASVNDAAKDSQQQEIVKTLMNKVIVEEVKGMILTDESVEVILSCIIAVKYLTTKFGAQKFAPYLEQIWGSILKVFKNETKSQDVLNGEYADQEAVEDKELGFMVDVCEAISEIAKLFGDQFEKYFVSLFDLIVVWTKRSDDLAITFLGLLADICGAIGKASIPYLPKILELAVVKGISSNNPSLQQNGLFITGTVLQNAGNAGVPFYEKTVKMMVPLLNSSHGNVSDNACGALSRMIASAPPGSLPIDNLLPLIVRALPLKVDFEENEAVFNCIFKLFAQSHKGLEQLIPQFVLVFSQVLGIQTLTPKIESTMITLLKALALKYPNEMQQIIQKLPNDNQQNLKKYLK